MQWSEAVPLAPDPAAVAAARARLPFVAMPDAAAAALGRAAAALGIPSLRAPLLAARAARAAAAFAGRDRVTEEDLATAAALVLAHRGRLPPEAAPEAAPEPPPPPPPPEAEGDPGQAGADDTPDRIPDEILLEAVRAALPADLLARLAAGRAARAAAGSAGTGAETRGNRRGRPLPPRAGRLGGGARLDLVATLRQAAPWQRLRAPAPGRADGLRIRPDDIRLKRFRETSDRVLIFVVDASGSAAMARLAEAKGAVEILLAQAYARRDHVALIAFRGTAAELLLPPTRSLVQTKRRLAGLPGGGPTPLAAGLRAALDVAELTRARGMTPTLALLTDGRGNIALDGTTDRGRAEADTASIARAIRARGIPALVLDTANRPQPGLRALAAALDAAYLPLPRADARRMAGTLAAALG
jgi:magnesium chelatase subunit D